MTGKTKKPQVHTTWELDAFLNPVLLAGGFAVPSRLKIASETSPGVQVDMHVVIEGAHARTDSLTVQTDRPGGIGLDVLRGIGVRNIMATAVLTALHRFQVAADGSARLDKVGPRDAAHSEEIREVVQGLVGWVRA